MSIGQVRSSLEDTLPSLQSSICQIAEEMPALRLGLVLKAEIDQDGKQASSHASNDEREIEELVRWNLPCRTSLSPVPRILIAHETTGCGCANLETEPFAATEPSKGSSRRPCERHPQQRDRIKLQPAQRCFSAMVLLSAENQARREQIIFGRCHFLCPIRGHR